MEEPSIHHMEKLIDEGASGIEKLQILMAFKTHVKKELVNKAAIDTYLDVLTKFLDVSEGDYKLQHLGHSSLCYLIKRVAMQQPGKFQASRINSLIRVVLLRSMVQERKVWASAVKCLEAIYLCKPLVFETELSHICLEMKCGERTKCLLFMDELIQQQSSNRSSMEIVNRFLDLWITVMNDESTEDKDVELIYDILRKYYNEQSLQQIACRVTKPRALELFAQTPGMEGENGAASPAAQSTITMTTCTFDPDEEVARVIDELPPNVIHSSIAGFKDYLSSEHLFRDLEQITASFQALKETEHNWKQRQDGIILMRRMVSGNVSRQFPDEFVQACKDLNIPDCISKAAVSLRTTLSSHSCHLIKEMALKLGSKLEPLVDMLFVPLKSLLSATKKISSQTAFATAVILLSNVPYHHRLFQQCMSLSRDKNVSPRTFAAVFLRIYIIRFSKRLEHSAGLVEEWLQKGLSDAQTQVREAMRITVWYWYASNPSSARKILDSLPSQMRRIVETAIPSYLNIDYHIASSGSSKESSRRSSLGARRFPSYAAPTHASSLQKFAATTLASVNARSLSDPNRHGTSYSSLSLAKKSYPVTKHDSITSRGMSAGMSSHGDNLSNDNLDLSDEPTNNHSNTLLKKYLNGDAGVQENRIEQESKGELESMYSHLSSDILQEKQQGLQFLLNLILLKTPLDAERLSPLLTQLSIQAPKSFKALLTRPSFHKLLPLINLVELCAINDIPTSTVIESFQPKDLINEITSSFKTFFPDHNDHLFLYYVKYRSVIFNFCFSIIIDIIENDFHFPSDNILFKTICENIFEACGNDFNMERYYSLISILYNVNKLQFVELLRYAPASSKFKIANELQRRDPTFNLQAILSRESSAETYPDNAVSKKSVKSSSFNGIDLENTRNLLEMTMVNPVGHTSIESVVHTKLDASSRHNSGREGSPSFHSTTSDHANFGKRHTDGDFNQALLDSDDDSPLAVAGEFKSLTEMTRVVSVYQNMVKEEDIDMIEEEKFRDSEDQENHVTSLNDIFRGDKHEQSVKFNEIPRIIDINKNWDRPDADTTGNTTNNGSDENQGNFSKVSDLAKKEMDKSPRLPLNEEETKVLSDGINDIEIRRHSDEIFEKRPQSKKHTDDPFMEDSRSTLSQPNEASTAPAASFMTYKDHLDILSGLREGSLTAFELEHLEGMDVTDMECRDIEEVIKTMGTSHPKFSDMSFLIGGIVNNATDEFTSWITKYHGLGRIWSMIIDLLETIDHSLKYRCVMYFSALIIANSQLNDPDISNDSISDACTFVMAELTELKTYDNEMYIASCEFRQALTEHYHREYLSILLEMCIKELNFSNERIKVTYLLQAIDEIISQMDTLLSMDVLQSLTNFLQKFVSSSFTEWRYHSIKLLSQVYCILLDRHCPMDFIRSTFSMLQPQELELIKSFVTRAEK